MFDGDDEVLARLDALAGATYRSRDDAFGALGEATARVNAKLSGPSADIGEKLRRWIKRLWELASKIAEAVEAVTFTISVGAGVSVGMTWEAGVTQRW